MSASLPLLPGVFQGRNRWEVVMPKYISGREIISLYDIRAFELAALCKEIPALSNDGRPVRDPLADPLKLPPQKHINLICYI